MRLLRSVGDKFRSLSLGQWVALVGAFAAVSGVAVSYLEYVDRRSSNEESGDVLPAVTIFHMENAPEQKPDHEWEYIEIRNEGDQLQDISYWTIEDEGAHYKYTFPKFELAAGSTVRVWTAGVHNGENDLVWGRPQSVWNNDGDVATLKDRQGNTIDELASRP